MMINHHIEEEELLTSASFHSDIQINSFSSYSSKVNWFVFCLICTFTLGSWLDISGVWCELPFMVDELAEGWRLPSILSVVSQIAQIGPFSFLIFKLMYPNKVNNVKVIYAIFFIGAISCALLSLLWDKSIVFHHEKRSVYLYAFNFFLSILDGMSTLTFLPYIGEHFSKEYIIPNYVGESMSSLVPGVLALLQGYKQEEPCDKTIHASNATSTVSPLYRPRFSVSVYFLFMFLLLLVSILSFSVLNYSNLAIRARKRPKRIDLNSTELDNDDDDDETIWQIEKEVRVASNSESNKRETRLLLMLTFLVTFVYYGYLPGLLSYSTMPYSKKFFHLSINLSNIFLPFSIIISIWSYEVSFKRIVLESLVPFSISFYILIVSLMSPCPPMVNFAQNFGGYVIVICWVSCSCLFMRIRCLIATKLEKHGKNILFTIGCFTIFGQVIGGIIIYLQVEVYRMFTDKPKCSDEHFCR